MIISVILSVILAVEFVIILDIVMALNGVHFKLSLYILSSAVLFIIINYKSFSPLQMLLFAFLPIIFATLTYRIWFELSKTAACFKNVDNGKIALYGNKRVMLIVPHQDDEINVLGGVMEEYLKYGSEIFIVYVITNGKIQGERWRESLQLCSHIGIPDDHVIFLGFEGLRRWNLRNNIDTMGIKGHNVYKEGLLFTRENVVNSMCEIITSTKPDTIFASDYDNHWDHHLVTVLFDEAMGKVLKTESTYQPSVIKSYAYRTTWESYPDYYQENIGSTYYKKDKFDSYHWEERLRFPGSAHMLNRSLLKSEVYRQYSFFRSQGATMRAINFNTDKVGWQRRTDNLLLHANIKVSSGDGSKLNDFKIIDKREFSKPAILPLTGAWIPTPEDNQKEALFTLQQPCYIDHIIIYQNPIGHVRKIGIKINENETFEHVLNDKNLPTRISINELAVSYIAVSILSADGNYAGITEIEAYATPQQYTFDYIKVANLADDFIYDYWIHKNGEETLKLYISGLVKQEYKTKVSNISCSVSLKNNQLLVKCPKGQTTLLTVSSIDEKYSDTVSISNPPSLDRFKIHVMQSIEHLYYGIFIGDYHRKATTLSIISMIK